MHNGKVERACSAPVTAHWMKLGERYSASVYFLAAICAGTAGAVLAIEASRLARNGRDWHTLLEFCAFVNSLIIDEDGIYDPRLVNDRLLLGLKGTFSELELSIFRQRSQQALRLKAARGDLYTTVAIGYRRSADDRLEQDPDLRILRRCLWCSASSAR